MRLLMGRFNSLPFKGWYVSRYLYRRFGRFVRAVPANKIAVEKPETIWQFWENPPHYSAVPLVVRGAIATVDKFRGDMNHIILDGKNLENYTDMPGWVMDRFRSGQMKFAHFGDLVRLDVLKHHGGVWMDATNYMTAQIPDEIMNLDFFVFHAITKGSPYGYFQNCFIRAKKNAWLLDAWHEMAMQYWRAEDKRMDYFQHQLMLRAIVQNDPRGKEFYARMPKIDQEPTHRFAGTYSRIPESGPSLLSPYDAEYWKRASADSFFQKFNHGLEARAPENSFMIQLSKIALGEK
jgi:hypothetical protein